MKRIIILVMTFHTFFLLLVYWGDVSNHGEDWSWMAAFFLDFPLSIWIHEALRIVERTVSLGSDALGLLVLHAIVGGLWWVGIVLVIRKILLKKRS
jgi:hypothetical protein